MGGTYERIADPWLARKETEGGAHFDSMGVNYTNEQALDCFLQVLELFRMGKDLYLGAELVHKIYPDGACYYSKDISGMKVVPMELVPSSGTLQVTVEHWADGARTWIVSTSTLASEPVVPGDAWKCGFRDLSGQPGGRTGLCLQRAIGQACVFLTE
jgi:hypothetical protein